MWTNPLPLRLLVCPEDRFVFPEGCTGLPIGNHPGAFGYTRKNHVHEGIDLYAAVGTDVRAVEDGLVVSVKPFTGPLAGLPWWLDTQIVLVEGASGVVAYGEIAPCVELGQAVVAGQVLGHVVRVLRHDKGRPTSMLHLELHAPGTRSTPEWYAEHGRPASLQDPTSHLITLASAETE